MAGLIHCMHLRSKYSSETRAENYCPFIAGSKLTCAITSPFVRAEQKPVLFKEVANQLRETASISTANILNSIQEKIIRVGVAGKQVWSDLNTHSQEISCINEGNM